MEKITDELTGVKTVAIAGHIRPDGDCIGSCMGMYLYLKENYPDIETDIYLEQPREGFSYISHLEDIKTACTEEKIYDLFITLDASTSDRIGVAQELFRKAKRRICIDHHVSNPGFADKDIICPQIGSASEVLYHLLEEEKITKPIAEAIYTGMAHDTGVFRYSCTTPDTMRIAAKLMEKGIDFSSIIDQSFCEKSYVQNQILGRCLMESIQVLHGKCIVGCLRRKDLEFYGVEVAVFLYELKTQEFKVSLRSKGSVDVNRVAVYFSGGGHVRAAGCTMQGSVYDVINNLTLQIEKQLKEKCSD